MVNGYLLLFLGFRPLEVAHVTIHIKTHYFKPLTDNQELDEIGQ